MHLRNLSSKKVISKALKGRPIRKGVQPFTLGARSGISFYRVPELVEGKKKGLSLLHAALFANEEAACSVYFALSPSTRSGTDASALIFSKCICEICVPKK